MATKPPQVDLLPTRVVRRRSDGRELVINESDYVEQLHEHPSAGGGADDSGEASGGDKPPADPPKKPAKRPAKPAGRGRGGRS